MKCYERRIDVAVIVQWAWIKWYNIVFDKVFGVFDQSNVFRFDLLQSNS